MQVMERCEERLKSQLTFCEEDVPVTGRAVPALVGGVELTHGDASPGTLHQGRNFLSGQPAELHARRSVGLLRTVLGMDSLQAIIGPPVPVHGERTRSQKAKSITLDGCTLHLIPSDHK